MKRIVFCLAFMVAITLSAQEQGVAPLVSQSQNLTAGKTRAVVVGISNYQDPAIPDLQFANRDAVAFVEWLQSPGGGKVPDEHIQLLLDEKATGAAVAGAIDWLVEETGEGDRSIIYFSGHGDVERNTLTQPGFLLCWDSGPRLYMAGGTYSVYFLQEMMSTLSVQKKAKVILVADACRAGKLAGSSINGPQLTANNLARQFESEIKILSCQSDEYSLEGKQWGGGRGVFSFHLIEGLTGLADQDGDFQVNLLEIAHYLDDIVPAEVAPLHQLPQAIGPRTETLARVDPGMLADLKQSKDHSMLVLDDIGGKGHPPAFLSEVDSNIQEIYAAFEKSLKNHHFLEPKENCAEYYYSQLIAEPSLTGQHNYITRKYAVALQDDAQQSINAILRSDPNTVLQSRIDFYTTYTDFPALLSRSAELLGKEHYMYPQLKARQHLFEGILHYFRYKAANKNDTVQGDSLLRYYQQSLAFEPELPVTHFFLSLCYGKLMGDKEQAKKEADLAVQYAGTWLLPYTEMAYLLSKDFRQFDESKVYLDMAMALDSTDAQVWKGLTAWHFYQQQIPEALEAAYRAVDLAPDDPFIWLNIGAIKQNQYQFEEAEAALLKSIALDSGFYNAHYLLAKNYYRWKKYELAEGAFLRAIDLDPMAEAARLGLAEFYAGFGRYKEAEVQFLELIRYTDPGPNSWYNLAAITTILGRPAEALPYLENALKKGFSNRNALETDPDLAPLRELPAYQKLIEKYFKN